MVSTVTDRLQGFSIGAAIKAPAYVATTGANITLESSQVVDGFFVGSSQRVLVKDQTDAKENGIYVSNGSTWVRASDCDGNNDLKPGSLVFVDRGTQNAETFWVFNSSSTALSLTLSTSTGGTADDLVLSNVTLALSGASAFSQTALANSSASGWRSTLGLVIGTDVQAYDTQLAELASLTPTTGSMFYFTAASSIALLAVGTSGQVLGSSGGLPVWEDAATSSVVRGHVAGMTLSNDALDTLHDINVTAGEATDAANAKLLTLSSEITKQIDATWAAGDDAGGLSSSLTAPANNTWYAVHLIEVSGAVDVGFDTSATAANLVADHSATAYRRIGWVLTDGSANIIAFTHKDNHFYWDDPAEDIGATAPSATVTATTLSAAPDTIARFMVGLDVNNGVAVQMRFYPVGLSETNPSLHTNAIVQADVGTEVGGNQHSSFLEVHVDSNSQINRDADGADGSFSIVTHGWIDHRGRLS